MPEMPEKPKVPSPLQPNVDLEAEAKKLGDYPLHPLISKITHKFGAFNLIRNARNQNQVDIEEIDNKS